MFRCVSFQASKSLARRSASLLSPSVARAVNNELQVTSTRSFATNDSSVKDPLEGSSAYLRSVASDVFALQNLFRSLASDSVVAQNFEQCVMKVLQCHDQQNRVFVTGMGKSGAVAQRLASTLSSISISSQWIHGGEWIHGELGGLKHGDMVIMVSHSGRTTELLPLPELFRKAGCSVMAIVGDDRSPLSQNCDLAIVAPAEDEADCPVPSRSIIVQEAICNAMVQHLIENMSDGAGHLKENHPGGKAKVDSSLATLRVLLQRSMTTPSRVGSQEIGDRSRNLHQLQLPNGNFRLNDPLLSKPIAQHHFNSCQPVRPQTSRRSCGKQAESMLSPRQKVPASSVDCHPSTAIVTSPVQSKTARPGISRLAIPDEDGELLKGKAHQRPASSPVPRQNDARLGNGPPHRQDAGPQFILPINPRAREHIEIKACLLAYTHHLDVDELQRIRGNNQLALNRYKMQRIIARGGAFSVDGSTHEEAKRKTTFLLRHFFMLQDSSSSPQNQLLYDVVEDWACGDQATPDEVSRLWKSINDHIEKSYLLRRKLVPKSDPDELSVIIAMDCLKKLPQSLPEYQRVLDTIITVIESGLYVNTVSPSSDPSLGDDELPQERKLLYFEAFRALQKMANADQALRPPYSARASLKNCPWPDKTNEISFRQQLEVLFTQLEADEDKKELFTVLLRSNLTMLAGLACEEVFKHYLGSEDAEDAGKFVSLLMQQMRPEHVTGLLEAISLTHSGVLQKFVLDNMDHFIGATPVATGITNEKTCPAMFQRLVDRHPQEFAAILWRSPYLTAHIFQGSENLVARVLEQNVYRISQVLTQRGEVLLPLLNHTFKENTTVLEDFLINHPRGLADLLMNRSAAIAAVVKTKPYILSDILQACHSTLTKVLASTPEIVSSVIKNNPQALPQIVREDSAILASVFATVPQCLGNTLEKHPEFFVDVAHRKPALVSRLFAEHPDLLLEPFEANPALFTTFLLYHRNVLPDFSDPNFDPTSFKMRTKILVESGVQTSNKLNQGRRKPRAREKLRRECEELLEPLRAATDKEITLIATCSLATEGSVKSEEEILTEDVLSTPQIVNEIARLYVAKMAADEHEDLIHRKRQSLANFTMDLYVVEMGLKPLAKKKLVNLLLAAKQVGNVPEAVRVKWFRRFMNAIPGDRPLPQTAFDFYLLVLQHLIPGGHLSLRLEAASFQSCTVSHSVLKALVDDPLVCRLFDNKEQRQRMLAFQSISTPSRQEATGVGRSSMTYLSVLQLDDVLDMLMKVWMQYQLRVRDEWAVAFQDIVPDASSVAHFDAFSTIVRSKLPELDNRTLIKLYNSCGEENEHGEFILLSEDFTFAMSILQEQYLLHQYTASSSSTASSAQLLSPFAVAHHSSRLPA